MLDVMRKFRIVFENIRLNGSDYKRKRYDELNAKNDCLLSIVEIVEFHLCREGLGIKRYRTPNQTNKYNKIEL